MVGVGEEGAVGVAGAVGVGGVEKEREGVEKEREDVEALVVILLSPAAAALIGRSVGVIVRGRGGWVVW